MLERGKHACYLHVWMGRSITLLQLASAVYVCVCVCEHLFRQSAFCYSLADSKCVLVHKVWDPFFDAPFAVGCIALFF